MHDVPFDLYCDHFLRALEWMGPRRLAIRLDGGEGCSGRVAIVRRGRKALPVARVATLGGDMIRPDAKAAERTEFVVPANAGLILTWD